ncbi:Type II restriction enzyme, methylase subunit YeeA [Corynebacterium glutamicum]|nr:Type II restriction enzyme, methylase subunit YeeA [Corynebacterium glutamicum]
MGSMPRDGGNLIVEPDEYDEVMADPIAAKFVRPFRMGREIVRGTDRWCLWLENIDPREISKSPILQQRLTAVKEFRERSKANSTQEMANTPHLFGQRSQKDVWRLCIPKVVSERRVYYTAQTISPDVIPGDKVYVVNDPDGLQFALISSSMFITWQKTIGGRLKSDISFANTLTWNTFPTPALSEKIKECIIRAGQSVVSARDLYPERSLADHYNPLAMDSALVKAHDALDREIDRAFGATRKLTNERQRQELLFANYFKLTQY